MVAPLVPLWLAACTPPEDLVKARIAAEGYTLQGLEKTETPHQWAFRGTRGEEGCTGTATVEGAEVTLTAECVPPPGPLERSLPEGAHDAAKRAAQGCDRGQQADCHKLGDYLTDGVPGVPADPPRGEALLVQACDGGVAAACASLGNRHLRGQGLAADPAKATAYLGLACKAKAIESCRTGGRALLTGDGIPADPKAGLALLHTACHEHDDVEICTFLGRVYDEGTYVPKDTPKAFFAWKHGCDLEDARCCGYTGVYLVNGTGTRRDEAGGRALIEKGCNGGDDYSCRRLKEIGGRP